MFVSRTIIKSNFVRSPYEIVARNNAHFYLEKNLRTAAATLVAGLRFIISVLFAYVNRIVRRRRHDNKSCKAITRYFPKRAKTHERFQVFFAHTLSMIKENLASFVRLFIARSLLPFFAPTANKQNSPITLVRVFRRCRLTPHAHNMCS